MFVSFHFSATSSLLHPRALVEPALPQNMVTSNGNASKATLTSDQMDMIGFVETFFSIVSFVSLLSIFASFYIFPAFRKPINRLILYAAIGNMGACIASFISTDGLKAGSDSALCQAQGFMIQL